MKELIRKTLREEIQKKYRRITPELLLMINKYLTVLFKGTKVTIFTSEHTYGDIRVEICKNNLVFAEIIINVNDELSVFENNEKYEDNASLSVSSSVMDQILTTFKIKKNLAMEVIVNYIEDNYLIDISKELGIKIYDIEEGYFNPVSRSCKQKVMDTPPELPIEDMIKWLVMNQTTFKQREIEQWDDVEIRYWYRRNWISNRAKELGYD